MTYNEWKSLHLQFLILALIATMLLSSLPVSATNGDVSPGVTIAGPIVGLVNTPYEYRAFFLRGNNDGIVAYNWTTDGDGVIDPADNAENVSIRWETPGTKTITVTATVNSTATVSPTTSTDTHTVVIREESDDGELREVDIRGPEAGVVNDIYPYYAVVFPENLKNAAVKYSWTTDGDGVIAQREEDAAAAVGIRWETPGTKTVTVTATLGTITVTDTHRVLIQQRPDDGELREVDIRGPEAGVVNDIYPYYAVVFPENLKNAAVKYSWTTDGDGIIIQPVDDTNQESEEHNAVAIKWETPGIKTVTVTATLDNITVTDTHRVLIHGQPNDGELRAVVIRGPEIGIVNETYPYAAFVLPAVEGEVAYAWSTDGDGIITQPADDTNQYNEQHNTVGIKWETPGTKTVTVTATLSTTTVTDTHTVLVLGQPDSGKLREVVIRAPEQGLVNIAHPFFAQVIPENAADGVTYSWQTDGGQIVGERDENSSFVRIRWEAAGTKVVTVTATKGETSVSDSARIVIRGQERGSELRDVVIRGPEKAIVNVPYVYAAFPIPWRTTAPVSYTWKADGGTVQLLSSEEADDVGRQNDSYNDGRGNPYRIWSRARIRWETPGTKVVTVTATSGSVTVTDTHTVVIYGRPGSDGLRDVTLIGPERGVVGSPYAFASFVRPLVAPGPFVYTWEATDQEAVKQQSNWPGDLMAFVWESPGTKLISVTVTNGVGEPVTATHTIVIGAAPETPQPIVYILGVRKGRAGSVFVIVGRHFAPNAEFTIRINGRVVATVVTNENGEFFYILVTSRNAVPGLYNVEVGDETDDNQSMGDSTLAEVTQRSATSYTIDNNPDVPLQEMPMNALGDAVSVPDDIAAQHLVFLPSVQR